MIRIDELITKLDDIDNMYQGGELEASKQQKIYNKVLEKMAETDARNNLENKEALIKDKKVLIKDNKEQERDNKELRKDLKKQKRFSKKKWSSLILAASLLICTVAYAATGNEWDIRLAQYLNLEDTVQLENGQCIIGESDVSNGVKVEAVSSVGDKHNVYILLEASFPEDIKWQEKCTFKDVKIEGINNGGYATTFFEMEDDNLEDNKKTFMLEISSEKINRQELTVHLQDIVLLETEDYTMGETAAKGNWNLHWKFNYASSVKNKWLYKMIRTNKESIFLTQADLSPISIRLVAYKNRFNSANKDKMYEIEKVVLKDGTEVSEFRGAMAGNKNNFKLDMTVNFINPIEVSQIYSIWIDGQEIVL